jgi:hypothetical protein
MSDLTTTQDVSYNGYQFSVYHRVVGLEARNVYDSAGRTVTHKVVRIQISDRVHDSANRTDNSLRTIRRFLETPGGRFVFEDKGWGPFSFNGDTKDLIWGPKPQVLSWRDVGDGRSAEFTWSVEVATLDAGGEQQKSIMEFNYTLAYSRDSSGYTARTYSGFLRIPQTRTSVNARALTDTADNYLEKIMPPLVPGFRRTTVDRTLSEDKCRLQFTVRDEEMDENVPPEYCIRAHAEHSVESDDSNLRKWGGTFSANYELQKGVPRSLGALLFTQLVRSRLSEAKKFIKGDAKGKGAQVIIPRQFSMREPEIYGKNSSAFSFRYSYVTDVGSILGASGLWLPAPGSDWKKWSTSISKALDARGLAALKFLPTDDAIIDLAAGQPPRVPSAGGGGKLNLQPEGLDEFLANIGFNPNDVTPSKSWLDYANTIRVEILDEVSELKKLPQAAPQQNAGNTSNLKAAAANLFKIPYAAAGAAGRVFQLRAAPTIVVTMTGNALRANHPIAPPELEDFGGLKPVAAGLPQNGFRQGVVANYGVPINAASWSLRYLLPGGEGLTAKLVENLVK